MLGVALLLTVATVGVEYGWQPGEDGQLEYIIQIEPELVKTLSEGKVDLLSEIPEELQGVKRFRIRVGTGPVPRKGLEQLGNIQPADDIAQQPPNLNSGAFPANDPRAIGTRRPTDPRATTTQPPANTTQPGGRVLNAPTQGQDTDRFTDTTGGAFPTVGRTPGIGRTTSTSRDVNDPTQPIGDRSPLGFDAATTTTGVNPRTGSATPVWDAATQQWRTPQTGTNLNPPGNATQDPRNLPVGQDPRYPNDPRTGGMPEVRRDGTQDPRGYNSTYPTNNPYPAGGYNQPNPNQTGQWNQPRGYNAPLRDPDPGYYPPPMYATRPEAMPYDPNYPMNRQVGYQVATNPTANVPPATAPQNPTATTTTPAATAAAATKPSASIPSRDYNRFDDELNKPWWPLTFTAMLLFGSIGLNFYLGWIAHGIYQRYRALLMEVRNVRAATI